MTQAHLMGLPVEESILPLVPVAAAMLTAVAVASRTFVAERLVAAQRSRTGRPTARADARRPQSARRGVSLRVDGESERSELRRQRLCVVPRERRRAGNPERPEHSVLGDLCHLVHRAFG